MSAPAPRVLLLAEAADPQSSSVPLVGWSCAQALARQVNAHIVTHIRHKPAFERLGWTGGDQFTALDSDAVSKPVKAADAWLRQKLGLGWTATAALSTLSYYYFERLVWQHFGERIARREFDIVHRVTPLGPTVPSIIAGRCRRAGVPFVWGPVNGGVPWPRGFGDVMRQEGEWLTYVRDAHHFLPGYRSTRNNAACIIVGSRDTRKQLAAWDDRCVYVPENAVDPARFTRMTEAPASGPLRVLFVGRLVPYKGADMLIEAAAELARERKLEIDIVGDGPQRPLLQERITKEGLEGVVRLVGWVPHGEVENHMCRSHVLGFPSIREFGGAVVLEAMMMGIVPIIADYAGPAEFVTDQTGYRLPLGSRADIVKAMRARLQALCTDRSELPRLASNGRRRILELYTWDVKAKQIGAVYDWVLGRAGKPDFGMPFPDPPSAAGA